MSDEDQTEATPGASTRACESCGAQLAAGQQFCTSCGANAQPDAKSTGGGLEPGQKRALGVIAAVVALVVIVALATSGGGDDDDSVAASPTTEDTVAEPTTEPTTTTTTIPTGETGSWVVTASDDRGYSSRIVLAIGTPEHADPNETEGYDPVDRKEEPRIKACVVTKATDAIVPVTVETTNTTVDFPEYLGLRLLLDEGSEAADLHVESDNDFVTGAQCLNPEDDDNAGTVYGFQTTEMVDPGAITTGEFLLVLHNYYSPVQPDGDVAAYQSLRLSPELTFGDTHGSDARRITDVSISRVGDPSSVAFQLVTSSDSF